MTAAAIPISIHDPVNRAILAVSEDRVQGFHRDPLAVIAAESGVDDATVVERIEAMLAAGVIRRVRQTVMATNLAAGALVAWEIPQEQMHAAFDLMSKHDPFSGHVVIRSTDGETPGSSYRLWTTVKVPPGFSLELHCRYLASVTGAARFRVMPARCMFALGVGHVRRSGLEPGSRAGALADIISTELMRLDELEWRVLIALKRELEPGELGHGLWAARAVEAGVSPATFQAVAERLAQRGLIGRFSTFLEHVKELPAGERVTRYNALFHWAVPAGREVEAGREVGRHHVITHAYWREAGPEFGNVNVMAVAHGTEKDWLLAHKAAIDVHLAEAGIEARYTNVFWGGRSEIKPSEISPVAYEQWCVARGIDPAAMRGTAPS